MNNNTLPLSNVRNPSVIIHAAFPHEKTSIDVDYSSGKYIYPQGKTIKNRFTLPKGYKRQKVTYQLKVFIHITKNIQDTDLGSWYSLKENQPLKVATQTFTIDDAREFIDSK